MAKTGIILQSGKPDEIVKLDKIVDESETILFKTKTRFPFDFFPNTVLLDKLRISYTNNLFFGTSNMRSILYADMENISASFNFLVGTIKIEEKSGNFPMVIKNLTKNDTVKIRKILSGIIISFKGKIDISKIETHILIKQLEKLGEKESG